MGEAKIFVSKNYYLKKEIMMTEQTYVENVENDVVEERENRFPIWGWIISVLTIILIVGIILFGIRVARQINQIEVAQEDLAASVSSKTTKDLFVVDFDDETSDAELPVRWEDAVEYAVGGSGPPDPAGVFDSNVTAVDHSSRLIVENPDLDVRACFPDLDDDDWKSIVDWSDQWGIDSPTRIEWQVNESRCSWVFPGNITDAISEEDYEELLGIFQESGYVDTWFVGGPEGGEFGRETYKELIALDATFNRVHIYGPSFSIMPTK